MNALAMSVLCVGFTAIVAFKPAQLDPLQIDAVGNGIAMFMAVAVLIAIVDTIRPWFK